MKFSLVGVVSWVVDNRGAILLSVGLVVAAASALIKALEGLVALFVTLVPSLVTVDGKLKGVAAWLDRLGSSSFLHVVSLAPRKPKTVVLLPEGIQAAKPLVPLVLLALVLGAAPARAQVLVSSGPTLPLMEVRPGNPHPVSLAPGAGVQLALSLPQLQRAIGGRAWDLVSLDLMAFGSAVSSTSGQTFGALSAAAGFSFLSSLFFVGGGYDVATAPGMKPGPFLLFALSLNVALAPSTPPAGSWYATAGLSHGNTLYLAAP